MITLQEWKDKYSPIKELEIGLPVNREIIKELSRRYTMYVWTRMYVEEELCIVSGVYLGNGIDIIICEAPHELNEIIKLNIFRSMNRSSEMVAEFMNTFKQPVLNNPIIPSEDRCKLRHSLLYEEVKELKEALINKDLKGVLDALVDLQYVLDGAIHEFGMGKIFADVFKEVHNANMSKTCDSEQEALDTVEKYKTEGVETYHSQHNGRWLVYRTSDNKVLKSINWKEADLSKFIK